VANVGGQYIYETFEDFQIAVNDAIVSMKADKEPILISGVCIRVGILRDTFYDYSERGAEWKKLHKWLKEISEHDINVKGLTGEVDKTMAIFNLKVNHGWIETQHIEVSTEPTVIVNDVPRPNA